MSDTIDWAAAYIDYGFALLPVKEKRPNFDVLKRCNGDTGWARYRAEKATIEDVEHWVELDPGTGIAIITGSASGLVVADYDSKPAPNLATATVRTAKGYHLYFSHDGVLPKKKTAFGDLQGENVYVVAPPSPTSIGTTYSWMPERGLSEVGLMPFEHAESLLRSSTSTIPIGVNVFTPKGIDTRGRSSRLADWDKHDVFVRAVCERVGIPQKAIGQNFRCVLPGHEESHPSASLTTDKNGAVVYRDWHAKDGREFYLLAEVYAAVTSGRVSPINGPELARWKLRMLIETNTLAPPSVTLPPLKSANASQTKVYNGLQLLMQARALAGDTDPFPFTAKFVSRWCQVSEDQAKSAIRFIREQGLLPIVGQFRSGPHTGHLYLTAGASSTATPTTEPSTAPRPSPPG